MLNPTINRTTPSRQSIIMIALLLFAITVPTAAFRAAQTAPAALTGSVYDPTGGVMPGVALTLENAQEAKQQQDAGPVPTVAASTGRTPAAAASSPAS